MVERVQRSEEYYPIFPLPLLFVHLILRRGWVLHITSFSVLTDRSGCGPRIRQGWGGWAAERAEGGVREEAIADEGEEALPRSVVKQHCGSEEVRGSCANCNPVTGVEETGAETEVERNMRGGGPARGASATASGRLCRSLAVLVYRPRERSSSPASCACCRISIHRWSNKEAKNGNQSCCEALSWQFVTEQPRIPHQ